jgi:hypothetical protein
MIRTVHPEQRASPVPWTASDERLTSVDTYCLVSVTYRGALILILQCNYINLQLLGTLPLSGCSVAVY